MLKIEKIKETAAGIKTEKPKILLFEAQKPKNRPNRKIENPPCSFGPFGFETSEQVYKYNC